MPVTSLFRAVTRLVRRPLAPRVFPTTGFDVIPKSQLVEEETWEWYRPEDFYSVQIGQVFQSKYQVVAKLGYGGSATAWLCRDLAHHRHVALKIGTRDALSGEVDVLKHLEALRKDNVGAFLVRDMIDEFEIVTEDKKYQALVHTPLSVTLREFRTMIPDRALPLSLLKPVLKFTFLALDFLHVKAKVIHTDIQEKNIILGLNEESANDDLEKFEQRELEYPTPRKIEGDRIIHTTRRLVPFIYPYGLPMLCDLGEARIGKYDPMVPIQPFQYRAPEVILGIPWDEKVDIWNVGVMIWDLSENGNLFKTTDGPDDEYNSDIHLAHMIGLLGPPPKDFLERSQKDLSRWFDADGNWTGPYEIPNTSLEEAEWKLEGDDKIQLLRLVRRMLKWKPEERETAEQLSADPWLNPTLNSPAK